jgi:glutathione S-transferase
MINLCGIGLSNYYNKVKLVMLEKGITYTEEAVRPSQDEALLRRSPLGKIPFIETEHGNLSESQAILEYLEESHPETPLYPANSFERAKCRELIQHLELNVELHARRLYGEVFFGGTVSDETKTQVKERLDIGLKGLARLAKFTPFIAGDKYSAADCVAWVHFFVVSASSQKIYGTDLVAAHLPDVARYMQLLETRPAIQKVAAERAAAIEAFFKK